jgi:hypothetical protein
MYYIIRDNPYLSFMFFVVMVWAITKLLITIINRNKPTTRCPCCEEDL